MENKERIVLDLCGGTGSWSKYYQEVGYDVRLIDLPNDVRFVEKPDFKVHGILAAPPCTVFATSGNRWKRSTAQMIEGISVMDACIRLVFLCQPTWWALENPVGKMRRYLGDPKLIFQPYEYGDPYTKRTLIWGNFNLPQKTLVEPTNGSQMAHKYGGSGKEMAKRKRAITPPGFAKAFFEANP